MLTYKWNMYYLLCQAKDQQTPESIGNRKKSSWESRSSRFKKKESVQGLVCRQRSFVSIFLGPFRESRSSSVLHVLHVPSSRSDCWEWLRVKEWKRERRERISWLQRYMYISGNLHVVLKRTNEQLLQISVVIISASVFFSLGIVLSTPSSLSWESFCWISVLVLGGVIDISWYSFLWDCQWWWITLFKFMLHLHMDLSLSFSEMCNWPFFRKNRGRKAPSANLPESLHNPITCGVYVVCDNINSTSQRLDSVTQQINTTTLAVFSLPR